LDVALKQRVVGAIVLVALAVIFLPMLLDGSGRPDRVDMSVEIPAEPDAPASRIESPSGAGDTGRVAEEEPGPRSESGASAQRAEEAASGPDEGARGTDDVAGDQDSKRETGAEAADTADSAPSAWAVQVGSFSRETNAVVLRDRLRQQGFEAFSEQAQADGDTTMWRVRVGPVPTRERAESLKAELESQRGEPALVTTYP